MLLFILEGLGTSELLLILVVALIIFGPRKLPQLSRSLGKSLGEFKRASEDFKQTWEKEVERESAFGQARIEEAMLPPEDRSILGEPVERGRAVLAASHAEAGDASVSSSPAAATTNDSTPAPVTAPELAPAAPEPTRKRDWL